MITLKNLPADIEEYRDRLWRRAPELRVESAIDAERMIEDVGFCGA
jgi:hypothetical protein